MDRKELDKIFLNEDVEIKFDAVKSFLKVSKKTRDYHYLYNKINTLGKNDRRLINIAILSSFTIAQIKEFLSVENFKYGLRNDIYLCGYNQYQQEIMNDNSLFYEFGADIVILAVQIEDLWPEYFSDFLKIDLIKIEKESHRIIELFNNLIRKIRSNKTSVKIFVNNFSYPSSDGKVQ